MALTPSQIRQIKKVIEEHMNVIMELTIGDTKVSPETLKKIGVPQLPFLFDVFVMVLMP